MGTGVTEGCVENAVSTVQPYGDNGFECLNGESGQANIIKTTASTPYGTVGVVVSKKSVDATLTSETETDQTPGAQGTTMYTTVQRYVLSSPRVRIVHSVTQNITRVDATGELVSSMVWVLSTQTNSDGGTLRTSAVLDESGLSGSITVNGYAPVDRIHSQDEFEQKAALCKEHRGSKRGSVLFFIQENEKAAHGSAFPAIRLVVNLYQQ